MSCDLYTTNYLTISFFVITAANGKSSGPLATVVFVHGDEYGWGNDNLQLYTIYLQKLNPTFYFL